MVDSLESLSPRPMSSRSCEAWENAGQVPESDKDLVLWEGGKLRKLPRRHRPFIATHSAATGCIQNALCQVAPAGLGTVPS